MKSTVGTEGGFSKAAGRRTPTKGQLMLSMGEEDWEDTDVGLGVKPMEF
jgi:hypothetical protein